jgi:hypothetical protein
MRPAMTNVLPCIPHDLSPQPGTWPGGRPAVALTCAPDGPPAHGLLDCEIFGVSEGIRTPDIQDHNLAL